MDHRIILSHWLPPKKRKEKIPTEQDVAELIKASGSKKVEAYVDKVLMLRFWQNNLSLLRLLRRPQTVISGLPNCNLAMESG